LYRSLFGGIIIGEQWIKYKIGWEESEPPRYETMAGKMAWVDFGWNFAVDANTLPPIHTALPNAIPNPHIFSGPLKWSAGGKVTNRILQGKAMP
jgi:hypothetical protein